MKQFRNYSGRKPGKKLNRQNWQHRRKKFYPRTSGILSEVICVIQKMIIPPAKTPNTSLKQKIELEIVIILFMLSLFFSLCGIVTALTQGVSTVVWRSFSLFLYPLVIHGATKLIYRLLSISRDLELYHGNGQIEIIPATRNSRYCYVKTQKTFALKKIYRPDVT